MVKKVSAKSTEDDKKKVVDILSKFTGHKNVKLVSRGNAAILCALYMVKKAHPKAFVLIPDQGGWTSFRTYPKILGFDVRSVNTNRGLIDLIDLEKKAESGAALIVTSFAGYFAEQPMKYISKICKRYNCILIEDASGGLADDELADGYYSDIIVGSFGKWKPVNLEYGGFVSCDKKELLDDAKNIFSATKFYPCYDALLAKLNNAKDRTAALMKKAEDVKQDISKKLPHLKIIHKDLRGLNVVASFFNKKEKQEIIDYCEKNGYDHRTCPEYNRVDEDAISIELKRLDTAAKKK